MLKVLERASVKNIIDKINKIKLIKEDNKHPAVNLFKNLISSGNFIIPIFIRNPKAIPNKEKEWNIVK
jgi:hypothetical protein